ncbi:MAG: methyltransferase domain-containing protein [Candidatus Nanohaloarchaeota archaeon QJJ-5]|nr:methyltransferase domain-containing protein [Candidatus Nanohaloarchaeota archaeon QJJ-5]
MVDLETTGRNYDIYVELMSDDAVIQQKISDITDDGQRFEGTEYLIDHGCSDGSLLEAMEHIYPDMGLVGIDLRDELLTRAQDRKQDHDLSAEFIKTDIEVANETLAQPEAIISSSLCHEIFSYGSEDKLTSYLQQSFDHLDDGGTMVIRDVIGPQEEMTWLWLNEDNGYAETGARFFRDDQQEAYLSSLSTRATFNRFCKDFAYIDQSPEQLIEDQREIDGRTYHRVPADHATDFMLTKDYTDNWDNEMQERFAFWDRDDYIETLETIGFEIDDCETYTNEWIEQNRFEDSAHMRSTVTEDPAYPATNIVIAAHKPYQ